MNIGDLERANNLAKNLIPKADSLLEMHGYSSENIGEYLRGLLKGDKIFESKFKQLLHETRMRFQKEFDEL